MTAINPRPRKYTRYLDAFYINVPRLLSMARDSGQSIPLPRNGSFEELRLLNHEELLAFRDHCEEFIASGCVKSVRINRVVDWTRIRPGAVISMAHNFETHSIPDVITWPDRRPLPRGEFGYAFRDVGGWRFRIDIEPRWIVSNSGALMFRHGIGYLSGLAVVKTVDPGHSIVYATGLLIGL